MSLLGIDIGTTGCKIAAYSERGDQLAIHYEEYQIQSPQPGWAQLDAVEVWEKVKLGIRSVAGQCDRDPFSSLSISSLGEAVVPVTNDREILGPSILNFDTRGSEFLPVLREKIQAEEFYAINGNTLGNQYGLTKLLWIMGNLPDLYEQADKFLLWSSFIAFMLGAEAVVDYSLANRTLLFDLETCDWSDDILAITDLDREKLPETAASGTPIGRVADRIAEELNFHQDVIITCGAHDQNAAAVGCGVIDTGRAVYSMGTFICITPVFSQPLEPSVMIERGLNTEHHAVPGKFVTFIYNQGGSIVQWFRDVFFDRELMQNSPGKEEIYKTLFAEIPTGPSEIIVLPHFSITGPPKFISESSGVMVGLKLDTSRGEILKGILEGVTYSLKEVVDSTSGTDLEIQEYRPVGGGSKAEAWIQTSADILGKPFKLPGVKEAGTLGAAIIAGIGSGTYSSFGEAVEVTEKIEKTYHPDMAMHQRYQANYEFHQQLWPLMADYLSDLARFKND